MLVTFRALIKLGFVKNFYCRLLTNVFRFVKNQ